MRWPPETSRDGILKSRCQTIRYTAGTLQDTLQIEEMMKVEVWTGDAGPLLLAALLLAAGCGVEKCMYSLLSRSCCRWRSARYPIHISGKVPYRNTE